MSGVNLSPLVRHDGFYLDPSEGIGKGYEEEEGMSNPPPYDPRFSNLQSQLDPIDGAQSCKKRPGFSKRLSVKIPEPFDTYGTGSAHRTAGPDNSSFVHENNNRGSVYVHPSPSLPYQRHNLRGSEHGSFTVDGLTNHTWAPGHENFRQYISHTSTVCTPPAIFEDQPYLPGTITSIDSKHEQAVYAGARTVMEQLARIVEVEGTQNHTKLAATSGSRTLSGWTDKPRIIWPNVNAKIHSFHAEAREYDHHHTFSVTQPSRLGETSYRVQTGKDTYMHPHRKYHSQADHVNHGLDAMPYHTAKHQHHEHDGASSALSEADTTSMLSSGRGNPLYLRTYTQGMQYLQDPKSNAWLYYDKALSSRANNMHLHDGKYTDTDKIYYDNALASCTDDVSSSLECTAGLRKLIAMAARNRHTHHGHQYVQAHANAEDRWIADFDVSGRDQMAYGAYESAQSLRHGPHTEYVCDSEPRERCLAHAERSHTQNSHSDQGNHPMVDHPHFGNKMDVGESAATSMDLAVLACYNAATHGRMGDSLRTRMVEHLESQHDTAVKGAEDGNSESNNRHTHTQLYPITSVDFVTGMGLIPQHSANEGNNITRTIAEDTSNSTWFHSDFDGRQSHDNRTIDFDGRQSHDNRTIDFDGRQSHLPAGAPECDLVRDRETYVTNSIVQLRAGLQVPSSECVLHHDMQAHTQDSSARWQSPAGRCSQMSSSQCLLDTNRKQYLQEFDQKHKSCDVGRVRRASCLDAIVCYKPVAAPPRGYGGDTESDAKDVGDANTDGDTHHCEPAQNHKRHDGRMVYTRHLNEHAHVLDGVLVHTLTSEHVNALSAGDNRSKSALQASDVSDAMSRRLARIHPVSSCTHESSPAPKARHLHSDEDMNKKLSYSAHGRPSGSGTVALLGEHMNRDSHCGVRVQPTCTRSEQPQSEGMSHEGDVMQVHPTSPSHARQRPHFTRAHTTHHSKPPTKSTDSQAHAHAHARHKPASQGYSGLRATMLETNSQHALGQAVKHSGQSHSALPTLPAIRTKAREQVVKYDGQNTQVIATSVYPSLRSMVRGMPSPIGSTLASQRALSVLMIQCGVRQRIARQRFDYVKRSMPGVIFVWMCAHECMYMCVHRV
jgi:hypothetical protein